MNILKLIEVGNYLKSLGLSLGDLNILWARVQEVIGADDTSVKVQGVLHIAEYLVKKTKNATDDAIVAALLDANANGKLADLIDAIRGVQKEPVFASAASDGPVEMSQDEVVEALAGVLA